MAIEDFTNWTYVDPNSKITHTASRMTANDVGRNESAYGYFDYGSDVFDGDFLHTFELVYQSAQRWGQVGFCGLAQTIGDFNNVDYALACLMRDDSFIPTIGAYERFNGSQFSATDIVVVEGTLYYGEAERDETAGTYECRLYTDPGRTNLFGTSTINLQGSSPYPDYRYGYGIWSYNTNNANRELSGYVENLDLEQGAPPPPPGGDLTVRYENRRRPRLFAPGLAR